MGNECTLGEFPSLYFTSSICGVGVAEALHPGALTHTASPLSSPSCRTYRVRSVPFLPQRPTRHLRLRGSHRKSEDHLQELHELGAVQLPQRLPLPVLGAVHQPAPLAAASHQRGAGLHVPSVRSLPAEPLDCWDHCEFTIRVFIEVGFLLA